MATQLGKPAINDPSAFDLRGVQQVIGNIRERFKTVDATITAIQTTQTAAAQQRASDLTALQRAIANLQQALSALTQVVNNLELGGDSDPRVEQLAGELMALQEAVDALGEPDDTGRVPQLEAQVGTMQAQLDEVDTVGQTPLHAALLHGLQAQVDDINRGVLV